MKKRWISLILCFVLLLSLSVTASAGYDAEETVAIEPRAAIAVGGNGYVFGMGVNFRSGPGTNYKSYGYVYKPDEFTVVTAPNSSWYKVTMKNGGFSGSTGYISSGLVSSGIPLNKWRVSEPSGANLRNGPSVDNIKLGVLDYGITFYVVGETWNDSEGFTWYKVCVTSGNNQGKLVI